MNLKKSVIISTIALSSIMTLTACSSKATNSSDKAAVVATMKGQQITSQDLYNKIKKDSSTQNAIRQTIVTDAFNKLYSDKISNKDVDSKFNETKKSYGSSFNDTLKSNGMTEDDYKKLLKDQEAIQYGLNANVSVTNDDLNKAWSTFHPKSDFNVAKFSDENAAKSFLEKAKSGDFVKLAKESAINKNEITTEVDSGATNIPKDVSTEMWKLHQGEITNVISTTNDTTQTKEYYVVQLTKEVKKGSDMNKYKSRLTEIVKANKLTDSTTMNKTIGTVLTKANVQIKDKDLSTLLVQYFTAK